MEGNIFCDPNVKVKYIVMLFLVNASPKPLHIAISNFAEA